MLRIQISMSSLYMCYYRTCTSDHFDDVHSQQNNWLIINLTNKWSLIGVINFFCTPNYPVSPFYRPTLMYSV